MINKFGLFLTYLYAICLSPSLDNPSPLDVIPSSMGSIPVRTSSFWEIANPFLPKRFVASLFPFSDLDEAASDQNFWNCNLRCGNTSKGDGEDASKK